MTLKELRLPLALLSGLVLAAAAARADVTETIKETYPFASDGVISLKNVNGDIDIVAWDRNEVSLEAVKKARTDEVMKALIVHIDLKGGDRLDIRTEYLKRSFWSNWGNDGRTVRYKLMVPASVSLKKIDTVNSDITVEGVRGAVDLDTVNGRIRAQGLASDGRFDTVNGSIVATFVSTAAAKRIVLDTVNGSCTLNLPADTGGRLKASSVNGSISCDIPVTIEKSGRHSLRGRIGSGEAEISLESVNGSLRIATN